MSPDLAELVKAYIPPWWCDEVITKEEAQFDYTNRDVEIIESFSSNWTPSGGFGSDWCSGWLESSLFYDMTLIKYYRDLEHFEPLLNLPDTGTW